MSEDKAHRLLSLLLAENGIPAPEGAGSAELMRRYLDADPLPTATENALAAIFDAAASPPEKPPAKPE